MPLKTVVGNPDISDNLKHLDQDRGKGNDGTTHREPDSQAESLS